jgi:ubiquitin-conjugating enzyme E2 Q
VLAHHSTWEVTMAAKTHRAKFQADLGSAIGSTIPYVSGISKADDGQCSFIFAHPLLPGPALELLLVLPEDSKYPQEHYFLAYATDDVPDGLSKTLDEFISQSTGLKVREALEALSRSFCIALGGDISQFSPNVDDIADTEMTDIEEEPDNNLEDDNDDDEDEFDGFEIDEDSNAIFGLGEPRRITTVPSQDQVKLSPEALSRVRRDLRAVRYGGFKVAPLCGLVGNAAYSIICMSVKVEKLCLCIETLEAWELRAEEYIVVLVRYNGPYQTFEATLDRASELSNLQFRIRKCSSSKPTLAQAINAFAGHDTNELASITDPGTTAADKGIEFGQLGIGQTIDTFMDSDFVPMLKLRIIYGVSWDAAKAALVKVSRSAYPTHAQELESIIADGSFESEAQADAVKVPAFLHAAWPVSHGDKSLPLIAAQFALRFFVRCTDYCMVCHRRVEGNYEALKPYVCDDKLCLFQYMSLGYGPNIEHEIISQPNVADLLISFCFAALQGAPQLRSSYVPGSSPVARVCGLREFPNGLSLLVPNVRSPYAPIVQPQSAPANAPSPNSETKIASGNTFTTAGMTLINSIDVVFNWDKSTMTFVNGTDAWKVREGNWVAIVSQLSPSSER